MGNIVSNDDYNRDYGTIMYRRGDINEYNYNNESLRIFFFGCWNRYACDDHKGKPSALSRVITAIKNSGSVYNFGIIAGDNIYPDKNKGSEDKKKTKKYFPEDRFPKAMSCIQQLGVPLWSVLGNHDIETCAVYHQQMNYVSWKMGNYYALVCNVGLNITNVKFRVLFIFIDTNLFSDTDESCYDIMGLTGKLKQQKKEEMLIWITSILDRYSQHVNHILFVGHEPIFGFKKKMKKEKKEDKQEMKQQTVKLVITYEDYSELFDILLNKNYGKKLYYLCADIHNFQYINITDASPHNHKFEHQQIDIIISGTGGAKPDPIINKLSSGGSGNFELENGIFKATLKEMKDSYGYCDILITKNDIKIKYNQVIKQDEEFEEQKENEFYPDLDINTFLKTD